MTKRRNHKTPYRIQWQEFGRGPTTTERFKTLQNAKQFIQERWQGPDYIDGDTAFHTDYCTYQLVGFKLADIGTTKHVWDQLDDGTEIYAGKEFTFLSDPDTPKPRRPMKTITKHFKTLSQAENFQNRLYDQYEYVRLVNNPTFSEDGTYQWHVKEKDEPDPQ